MGALVIALGDGVGDAPGVQPGPVGAAAVVLVGDQVVGTHPRPADPTGTGHPDRIHQSQQSGSVSRLASCSAGHQRPAAPITHHMDLGRQAALERLNPC